MVQVNQYITKIMSSVDGASVCMTDVEVTVILRLRSDISIPQVYYL